MSINLKAVWVCSVAVIVHSQVNAQTLKECKGNVIDPEVRPQCMPNHLYLDLQRRPLKKVYRHIDFSSTFLSLNRCGPLTRIETTTSKWTRHPTRPFRPRCRRSGLAAAQLTMVRVGKKRREIFPYYPGYINI